MRYTNDEVAEMRRSFFAEEMAKAPIPMAQMRPLEQVEWERKCMNAADDRTTERVSRGEWSLFVNSQRRDLSKLPDPDAPNFRPPRRIVKHWDEFVASVVAAASRY